MYKMYLQSFSKILKIVVLLEKLILFMTHLKFSGLKKSVFFGLFSLVFLASLSLFSACSKKEGKSETTSLSESAKKLEGTWISLHEPYGYVFKSNGSYDLIDTAPEAVRESGTWTTEGDNVVMTNTVTKVKESQKINFIDGILFFGEVPQFDANCVGCEYTNVTEYVKDMGLHKK